jgi:signal transduction histidine kinase
MRSRWLVADGVLAAVLTLAGLGRALFAPPDTPAPGIALILAAGAALVVRRRWPVAVLAVTTAATTAYLVLDYAYGPLMIMFGVAVYTVARHSALAWAVPAAVVAELAFLAHIPFHSEARNGFMAVTWAAGWVVVPFVVGVTVRVTREASQRARADAIRLRVDEERLRVAQEVHDIVGHGLAAIKMQADVALHVLPKRPEQAGIALETISRTSGEALQELRATLSAVRGDEGSASLARIEELRERMSGAGLRVLVETVGEPRRLPAVVDLTGYRVVQESLTNVLRHSGADEATVTLRYDDTALDVTVTNPVTGPVRTDGGSGIAGMRQRVHALGGEFSITADDGRFTVNARLPIRDAS